MRRMFALGSALLVLVGCDLLYNDESTVEPFDSSQGRPLEEHKVRPHSGENEQTEAPGVSGTQSGQPETRPLDLTQMRQFMIGTFKHDPSSAENCAAAGMTFREDGGATEGRDNFRWSLREEGGRFLLTTDAGGVSLTYTVAPEGNNLRLNNGILLQRCT